jgi:hypothetical protein
MIFVVSPYHMTSREPAAMVSMVLARNIVTAMPTPAGVLSRDSVAGAAARVPKYVELMESWDWATPLFAGGVCGTTYAGEDPLDDVLGVCADIEALDRYATLRPFMRTILEQGDDRVISAISRDVMKAGPDPAISVPLSAAIDRFAARHDLIAVRSESKSTAQKAEAKLAQPVLRFAFETLLQGPTSRLLEIRTELEIELDRLRNAIDEHDEQAARIAADALTASFDRDREDFLRNNDPDEVRAISGMVSVLLSELPDDAVLTSSAFAATRVLGRGHEDRDVSQRSEGVVRSILIRPIGGRKPRR